MPHGALPLQMGTASQIGNSASAAKLFHNVTGYRA
jgi:hypothetical protein